MRRKWQQRLRLAAAGALILALPWGWYVAQGMADRREAMDSPSSWRLAVPGARSFVMQRLPGGSLWLGSPEEALDASLRRDAVVPFSIATTEVRVRDFVVYLNRVPQNQHGYSGSAQIHLKGGEYIAVRGMSDHPVSEVNYKDAADYCAWLGAETGGEIRLPTEAEWEYAARGGLHGAPYPHGWSLNPNWVSAGTHPVGRGGPANGYGLYDMAGNVFEWCIAPMGSPDGVARGGSFSERAPELFRVSRRVPFPRTYRDRDVGFRIVAVDPW